VGEEDGEHSEERQSQSVVVGAPELLDPIRADAMIDVGGVVSPFNAWLISRGAITLPLRLRQHFASAQRIAEFLADHPAIAYVAYPGLPSHPQHALARRLFADRGYGAVLAFALDGDADLQNRFVAQLHLGVDPHPNPVDTATAKTTTRPESRWKAFASSLAMTRTPPR
jgi:O-acetylhomoserine/O-acetylserine sulfhydrylase-like pyridoxal-dependent enzyme